MSNESTFGAHEKIPPLNILVVEDNDTTREVYDFILKRDHNVSSVGTAEEALSFCESHAVDLVLLDVVLPDLFGTELCEILKNKPTTQNIKIILMSSYQWPENEHPEKKARCDAFLKKPLIDKQLRECIANLFLSK